MLSNLFAQNTYWLVASSAWLCRLLLLGVRFLSISLLLDYLGIERYALFSIIASFEAWFQLCDLGLGSSVQNFLSESRFSGVDTSRLMRSMMQLCIFIFLSGLLVIVLGGPFFGHMLFSSSLNMSECTLALQVAGICYGTTALGTVAYRALFAFQKGYFSYCLQAGSSLIALALLWFFTTQYRGEERLLVTLVCTLGIPALVASAVFIRVFPVRELFSKPDFQEIKRITIRAAHFFGFGLINTAILAIDYVVMMQVLSSADIVVYNIFSRVFLAAFSIYALLLQALWPVCSELIALKRYQELMKLIRCYSAYGILLVLVTTGGLIVFSTSVLNLFSLDASLCITLSTLALFGIYYLIRVICDSYSMLLQSMSELKIFFVLGPLQAALSYGCQKMFAKQYGLNGIVTGLICSFALTMLWALPLTVYRKIGKKTLNEGEKT